MITLQRRNRDKAMALSLFYTAKRRIFTDNKQIVYILLPEFAAIFAFVPAIAAAGCQRPPAADMPRTAAAVPLCPPPS